MEENKQVVAEWKALNQPRLQEIKKANPDLYSAVNLALQYLNTKLGGEELPAEVEVEEEVVETTPMQTKKWTFADFLDKKIIVDTPEKSKKFQELVFSLGIKWTSGENKVPMLLNEKYIQIYKDAEMSYTSSKDKFDSNLKEEIFYDDIFPPQTETKQWTLDDFKNIKIIVDTPDKSRKFQELFLSLGGEWSRIDNPNPTKPANLDKAYLVSNGTKLLFFDKYKTFEDQTDLKQIFYDDIFPGESETTSPEPATSSQQKKYGLPIETYPTSFSFPIPGFSANTGDRKSPTQSAGELRRWYFTLGNVAQIDYARELDRARFKGNDGNWYALVTGKSGVWSWKKTTPPPTQYTASAASSSGFASTQPGASTSSATVQQQHAATKQWRPEDLVGKKLLWSGREYDVIKFRRNNPKYKSYTLRNAMGVELEGKLTMGAIQKLLNDEPVKGISIIKPKLQPTTSQSFEDSLTSLSDVELKQLYDDTYEARKEFIITEPEYLELSQQIVAIGNEMDNRNL